MVYLLRDNHLFDRIAVQNATCKNWQIATQVKKDISIAVFVNRETDHGIIYWGQSSEPSTLLC